MSDMEYESEEEYEYTYSDEDESQASYSSHHAMDESASLEMETEVEEGSKKRKSRGRTSSLGDVVMKGEFLIFDKRLERVKRVRVEGDGSWQILDLNCWAVVGRDSILY